MDVGNGAAVHLDELPGAALGAVAFLGHRGVVVDPLRGNDFVYNVEVTLVKGLFDETPGQGFVLFRHWSAPSSHFR